MSPAVADRERMARALELVALVEESWPAARFTDDQRKRYAADVLHLDAEEAQAAVEIMKRAPGRDGRGREFPPPAGDVCREVARLQVDAPDWGEVKRQLVKRWDATVQARENPRPWTCPHGVCDGNGFAVDEATNTATDCECRPAMLASRRGDPLHPLLQEFIDESYVTWTEVEAVGRGMNTTLESQMRAKWEAFAQQAVESRAIASLEGPPTLRRLERARDEDPPRRRAEIDLVAYLLEDDVGGPGEVRQLHPAGE